MNDFFKYFLIVLSGLVIFLVLIFNAPAPAKAGVSVYTPWGGFSYSGPRRYYGHRRYYAPRYRYRRYYTPRPYYGPYRRPNTFWECNSVTCWEKFPGY